MDSGDIPNTQTSGIALSCNMQGTILQVIHDGLGLDIRPGQLLIRMVDRGTIGKLLSFLVQVKEKGTVLDWDLNVSMAGEVKTLHFAGFKMDGDLLIIGSTTRGGMLTLCEETIQIANEQANVLRAIAKERVELIRSQEERDSSLYDEISSLNNELVTLQRELAKKNVELAKLNELKNQFLGMTAHDLRNPLSNILTYSEFLIREASDVLGEEHREFLSIIRSSTDFMLGLVENLLDVARIESGRLDLELEPTDLERLIERNVALNRPLAAEKEIAILLDHSDKLEEIMIDPGRIEQVMNNLLSNAIKFSPARSIIRIRTHKDRENTLISIADEGAGIPADQLIKLFKPFGRTTVRGTRGEKSTGLGLVIVKRIIEEHKGKVWIESEPEKGSTFYVSLPLHRKRQ